MIRPFHSLYTVFRIALSHDLPARAINSRNIKNISTLWNGQS